MFQTFKSLATPRNLSSVFKRNIAVGQALPKGDLTYFEYNNGTYEKKTAPAEKLFAGKNILVGFPGAFTPVCSTQLPEYIKEASNLRTAGAKKVYALTVNDPFVVQAFADKLGAKDSVTFIADYDGSYVKKLDVGIDLSAGGLGTRSRRFSMLVKDGKVEQFNDEQGPKLTDLSKVANILSQLKAAAK